MDCFVENHGGQGEEFEYNLNDPYNGMHGFPGVTWDTGINSSNIFVTGSKNKGHVKVIDTLDIDNTIKLIMYDGSINGYNINDSGYSFFEVQNNLMPSKSAISFLNMNNIGSIFKYSGLFKEKILIHVVFI